MLGSILMAFDLNPFAALGAAIVGNSAGSRQGAASLRRDLGTGLWSHQLQAQLEQGAQQLRAQQQLMSGPITYVDETMSHQEQLRQIEIQEERLRAKQAARASRDKVFRMQLKRDQRRQTFLDRPWVKFRLWFWGMLGVSNYEIIRGIKGGYKRQEN